ncbi:transmembrane 9 superfamily member 2-like [Paramacrobiotus metropolitanus]|uniref:transmembrane 9 superfamily member 2-like n=1 Tax=Paramacrobiotus metropolitanus TaxID=2943436 RepID=UPI002445F902|nr:transmembrane 9 superfamily member 2-like [Paramacrobiotus metropolitanus]
MGKARWLRSALAVLSLSAVQGFYLPGLAPVDYCNKKAIDAGQQGCTPNSDQLAVFVNRLNSEHATIPYEYHYFDFCKVDDKDEYSNSPVENLGQVVFGDRLRPSPYVLTFNEDKSGCVEVCSRSYDLSNQDQLEKVRKLRAGINLNYQHHWMLDNMPITWCYQVQATAADGTAVSSPEQYCSIGFPMGCYITQEGQQKFPCPIQDEVARRKEGFYIYNHVDLVVHYHRVDDADTEATRARIVRIDIKPRSFDHGVCDFQRQPHLRLLPPLALPADEKPEKAGVFNLTYTYSVRFVKEDNIKWSSRWDYILDSQPQSKIQWFSILNSLVIVLFLTGMIALILLRTLRRDIARYNQLENSDDAQEEYGWKLIHGDVFRAPHKGMILSVLVGSGSQVLVMTLITLVFACMGFLSPANRGALMTCALFLYVCLGTVAGYVSSRLYKMLGGDRWKANVLLTALLCPGVVFGIFFVLNIVLLAEGSSAAVPFTTLLALLGLWFGVSVPLTFLGAYFGFKRRPLENPVRVNQIPRQIPDQTCYTRPLPGILMGGILPFGCIFIQLYFILNSIWADQTYYMFGFLFLVFLILLVTCSETAILLAYFHLCSEDYRWWWRSFLTSGMTAGYLAIYCVHYYATKLDMTGAASGFVYFGYTLIIVFLLWLLTGTIGFLASYWFVRKVYGSIKVD